jgi:ornithine lipid ester-linked acyl 2-hydroxylase
VWFGIAIAPLVLVWLLEPRLFLFLFERFFFVVDRSRVFIEDKAQHFSGHEKVEAHLEVLTEEVQRLIEDPTIIPKAHELDKLNEPISTPDGPGWRTFYLKVYSGWFEKNCAKCPRTFELFRDMPQVSTVMYSVMEPGNVIPRHHGELRGILRYQLPLIVPPGACFIEVAGRRHDYERGQSILFDDVQEHTVTNATTGYRVILFLDVQKRAAGWIQAIDNLLLRLVTWSPRFRKIAHS